LVDLRHLTASTARRCLLVAVIACVSATCSKKGPTQPDPQPQPQPQPTLTSVTVSSTRASITVGDTEQFSATANFSNNTTQNVTATASWSSATTGVATVSSSGVATGVSAGSTDIRAAFQSVTGSRALQVTPPAQVAPVARFAVTGPGGNNTCRILVGSGGDWDCRFDGTASTGGTGGNVVRWRWRFDVGANSSSPQDDSDPIFDPNPGCGFFATRPDRSPGTSFVQMIVKLEVFNAAGTASAEARNADVRLFPQNQCGFGF
jgi:Bacterial Ig-like domain (group 2)